MVPNTTLELSQLQPLTPVIRDEIPDRMLVFTRVDLQDSKNADGTSTAGEFACAGNQTVMQIVGDAQAILRDTCKIDDADFLNPEARAHRLAQVVRQAVQGAADVTKAIAYLAQHPDHRQSWNRLLQGDLAMFAAAEGMEAMRKKFAASWPVTHPCTLLWATEMCALDAGIALVQTALDIVDTYWLRPGLPPRWSEEFQKLTTSDPVLREWPRATYREWDQFLGGLRPIYDIDMGVRRFELQLERELREVIEARQIQLAKADNPRRRRASANVRKKPTALAMEAYRLVIAKGMKQTEAAKSLASTFTRPVSQGQVSRWCNQVKLSNSEVGLRSHFSQAPARAVSVNPGIIEMGKRTDGLTKRQRESRSEDGDD